MSGFILALLSFLMYFNWLNIRSQDTGRFLFRYLGTPPTSIFAPSVLLIIGCYIIGGDPRTPPPLVI